MNLPFRYRATVLRVIDGDTYDMSVDLGFRTTIKIRVRLHQFNTAELNSPVELIREEAIRARDWVEDRILFEEVVIDSVKTAVFNRWEAKVAFIDPDTGEWTDLGTALHEAGHAKVWQKQ